MLRRAVGPLTERARRRQPAAPRVPEHPDVAAEPAGAAPSSDPAHRRRAAAREGSRARAAGAARRRLAGGRRAHRRRGRARSTARSAGRDSFDALHELLEAQAYRLSYWRTASHEINYRRFFDVNDARRPARRGSGGLRRDARSCSSQLRARGQRPGRAHRSSRRPVRSRAVLRACCSSCARRRPLRARREDPVERRDAAGALGGRRARPATTTSTISTASSSTRAEARRMRRAYAKLTGRTDPFDDVVYESKRLIMETAMASELNVLAHALERIAEGNRRSRDFTLDSLRDTITEVVACFPVYRTYVDERGWTPERSRRRRARDRPRAAAQPGDGGVALRLLPRGDDAAQPGGRPTRPRPDDRRDGYPPADADEAHERLRFAMKFQQYTGPVQAKGLEDTAFYPLQPAAVAQRGRRRRRAVRPAGRGVPRGERAPAARRARYEMLATATHDTKLGEDTRARINVLSEMPDEWSREVGALDADEQQPIARSSTASRRRIATTSTASIRRWSALAADDRGRVARAVPADLVDAAARPTCSSRSRKPSSTRAG